MFRARWKGREVRARGAVVVVVVVEDVIDVVATAVVAFLLLLIYCFLRGSLYLFRPSSLPTPCLRAPPNFEQGGSLTVHHGLIRLYSRCAGRW